MISTEIGSIAKHISYEKAVEAVAKAGFDGFDLSMFDMARFNWSNGTVSHTAYPSDHNECLKFVRRLKKIGEDNGIVCNQAHAPFPCNNPDITGYLPRALECAAAAGADCCVVHPLNDGTIRQNTVFFNGLLPYAEEYGIKIASENMWNWDKENDHALPAACATPESFTTLLRSVNNPLFVACLDIGHAEMRGIGTSAAEMILALGDDLKALHIHDNDKWHDSHNIPFSMDIDFESVAAALKKINYKGWYTLEADTYLNDCKTEGETIEGIKRLAEAARRFEALCK